MSLPLPFCRTVSRLLIANRSEIAIRVCRAANELGITTLAIYSHEDRFALHRFKADESYPVGIGRGPVEAYLDIADIVRIAREVNADAIHPGYGFLSENPEFAEACQCNDILFIGPSPETMRILGNKVSARALAIKAAVPVIPATGPLPDDPDTVKALAFGIGFPLMVKASWGGGGRGMRRVERILDLLPLIDEARREARAACGSDEVYLEKLVSQARHVEVQVIGDNSGYVVHLFERDCSVQRRNQKVVERAPAAWLDAPVRQAMCDAALRIAREAAYVNAGTVEFLVDVDSGQFYFIEVNPRIQVEHTVTEVVTGLDIVKAQIRIAQGAMIGTRESGIPQQPDIHLSGHAIQCRITTEDPENNFIPDYGRITAYRGAAGFGIRLDGGTAYSGALITRYYDSLLEKITAWAPTPDEAVSRMLRALREFRIRGVATNLHFLENVVAHSRFRSGGCTTRFIDTAPELFQHHKRRDRATRLLRFLGEVMVNGNPDMKGRVAPARVHRPRPPVCDPGPIPEGWKQILDRDGPEGVVRVMLECPRILITDTTFRDAHQSLLATRLRTRDMLDVAPFYASRLSGLFSLECWGGATFDVAMRFLGECPWERLAAFRSAMPNMLLQMLLRSANAVGYKNYPDNVVRYFIRRSAESGVDLFRIFDNFNWVENMRVAIDEVRSCGKLAEVSLCYTGDILDPGRSKYTLSYYVQLAREMERAGAHIIGIKDMAGLCKPEAARRLVHALKEAVSLPVHFHTHDTGGIAAASVLAAVEAGVDAVDAAIDSMSSLTSQPNLGSIVEALRYGSRDPGLDRDALRQVSDWFESVRANYAPWESDIRAGTSDVYHHEMPGGQYTNLREQARSLGIEERWPDVSRAYADVNRLFGDLVKVTPSSKVVGDMALVMVTAGLSCDDILDPHHDTAFPDSVVSMFRGDIGQTKGGFPRSLQDKILKGQKPLTVRPGAVLPEADLTSLRTAAEKKAARKISDHEFASFLMYPDIFMDYVRHLREYGEVWLLPTSAFFYGMEAGEEIAVEIDTGKTLLICLRTLSDVDEDGTRTVYFELNGQPRTVKVIDRSHTPVRQGRCQADLSVAGQIGAPMPGLVVQVSVREGQVLEKGDVLLAVEAMKMQTSVVSDISGTVRHVAVAVGDQVDTKDLLVIIDS